MDERAVEREQSLAGRRAGRISVGLGDDRFGRKLPAASYTQTSTVRSNAQFQTNLRLTGLRAGSNRNFARISLITPPPNQPLALRPHRHPSGSNITFTTVWWSTHRPVKRSKGRAAFQRCPVAAMRDCDFPFRLGQYHKAAARHYYVR